MLHFQINPHSGVPVYRQMADQVKFYVTSDVLKPGDQLPSIRDLAHALSINPTTVVRVYSELEREGIVEMRHGKGAFVAAQARRMSAREVSERLHSLARHLVVEAKQIGASPAQVMRVVREELAEVNDVPEEDGGATVSARLRIAG